MVGDLPAPPARKIAIVTCMDARLTPSSLLGLKAGDAHILRNAGGIVTADTIRSLAFSQHMLGTRDVMVIQHTKCGLGSATDDDLLALLPEKPHWKPETFSDIDASVAEGVRRVRESKYLPHTETVRGFVFDIDLGALREVE